MITLLASWIVSALIIMAAGYVVPGVEIEGFQVALITALMIGILNVFVRPLLTLITLLITILTLGLFSFVINALMIWATAEWIVTGFDLASFWAAIWMALFIALAYSFFSMILTRFR